MRIGFNFQQGSRIRGQVSQGARTAPLSVDAWGASHQALMAVAGRMNKFNIQVPGSMAQPGGGYTLDLLAEKDGRSVPFTTPDGMGAVLEVQPRVQGDGWGAGDYYMLETDADGWLIVEPGRNHRKVYVSGGPNAYSKARIAAEAGVTEATVTNAWLEARPEYGSQAKPFDDATGKSFYKDHLIAVSKPASSHWILYERGYTYSRLGTLSDGTRGESALHPLVIGAWGTGTPPKGPGFGSNGTTLSHIVLRDTEDGGFTGRNGAFIMASNVVTSTNEAMAGNAQYSIEYGTQHRCWTHNLVQDAPSNGSYWTSGSNDRISGGFWSYFHGLLFLESGFYHNGWADGYDPDGAWNNGQFGQPPTMYSHNVYIQYHCRDVDIDAGWTISGASMGWQMRSGGWVRNTVMADNGVAMNDLGGKYEGSGHVGNHSLILGNVATEAAWHEGAPSIGALNWGLDTNSKMVSVLDNVVMHMADPDSPADLARKTKKAWASRARQDNILIDNTLHFKWSNTDEIRGLSPSALMTITLQRFAKQEMGSANPVTVRQFGAWLKTRTAKERTEILWRFHDYVRAAYGSKFDTLPITRRTANATLDFSPDPRGDGFRADTELNWSTRDLPRNGDTIRQNGNRIKWPKYTRTIAGWTSGGGLLEVTSGKLTIQTLNDAIKTRVAVSGQLVLPAGSGQHEVRGGRLTFTGAHSAGLDISADAEVVFGPNLTIPAGKALRIDGGQCFTGWTGTGTATLTLTGTLDIRSTLIVQAAAMLYRYRRGTAFKGETSGFTGILDSQVKINRNDWTTAIRNFSGMPVVGENMLSPDANGVYPLAVGIQETAPPPSVRSIGAATLPSIGKFKTNGDHPEPTVNVTVALSGPLRLDLTGVPAGTYTLIEANAITGNFASQQITGLGSGLTATVNKTTTKVEVVVA